MRRKHAFILSAFLLLATALFPRPVDAYEVAQERRVVYFNWFWNVGSNVNECYGSCVGACYPACYAAGAAAGVTSIDCSTCPGSCAGTCPSYFAIGIQADDAHPLGGTGITQGDDFQTLPTDQPPAGVTNQPIRCPPGQIPYSNLGCVDPNWKNNYCAGASSSCGACAGRGGCLWTGASCVACNTPTCIFTCPAGPRVVSRPVDIPTPTPGPPATGPTPVPTPVTTVIPLPTTIPTTTIPPGGVTPVPTTIVTVTPVATVLPTPPPFPTPKPGAQCNGYRNCTLCAEAPRDAGNRTQCGWSDFAGACLSNEAWNSVNNASLKAGFITNPRYCTEPAEVYCYQYNDCLSCAGNGGLKRRCQWSVKEDRCVPYNPLGDFRTQKKPEGNDILLPNLCAVPDCAQYSECRPCEQNAACLWSKDEQTCVRFDPGVDLKKYQFYPGNCPVGKATPTPTPTPAPCPTGCTCDKQSRVLACGGTPVSPSLIPAERAVANAGAGAQLQRVTEVTLNPAGPSPTYTVRGSRDGIFLYFLPLPIGVTTTVNAKTGAVEKVEQPWWASLTG